MSIDHIDHEGLLGGAERKRVRVRRFAPWSPQAATLALLERVRGVLGEYEDHLPLTIRQIFYRLVGAHAYEKDERAYERLCEMLNRARRGRMIPMDAIRDDGGTILAPNAWDSGEEFLDIVRRQAEKPRARPHRGAGIPAGRDLRGGGHGAAAWRGLPIPSA